MRADRVLNEFELLVEFPEEYLAIRKQYPVDTVVAYKDERDYWFGGYQVASYKGVFMGNDLVICAVARKPNGLHIEIGLDEYTSGGHEIQYCKPGEYNE